MSGGPSFSSLDQVEATQPYEDEDEVEGEGYSMDNKGPMGSYRATGFTRTGPSRLPRPRSRESWTPTELLLGGGCVALAVLLIVRDICLSNILE